MTPAGFGGDPGRWPPGVFVHLAIKYSKPEHVADNVASMRRVADAAQGAPGLIAIGPWLDARSGRVIGLSLWESRGAFESAMPAVFGSLPDLDPDGDWDGRPPDSFHLTPA